MSGRVAEYLSGIPADWNFVNPFTVGLLMLGILAGSVLITSHLLRGLFAGVVAAIVCFLLYVVMLFGFGAILPFLSSGLIIALSFFTTMGMYAYYVVTAYHMRHMTAEHSVIFSIPKTPSDPKSPTVKSIRNRDGY